MYEAIVNLLQREKSAGATVLRGVAGFGSHYQYHTQKILRLAQELPIIIEVVDYTERIEKILRRLDEMIGGGLITLEKARVILYRARESRQAGPIARTQCRAREKAEWMATDTRACLRLGVQF